METETLLSLATEDNFKVRLAKCHLYRIGTGQTTVPRDGQMEAIMAAAAFHAHAAGRADSVKVCVSIDGSVESSLVAAPPFRFALGNTRYLSIRQTVYACRNCGGDANEEDHTKGLVGTNCMEALMDKEGERPESLGEHKSFFVSALYDKSLVGFASSEGKVILVAREHLFTTTINNHVFPRQPWMSGPVALGEGALAVDKEAEKKKAPKRRKPENGTEIADEKRVIRRPSKEEAKGSVGPVLNQSPVSQVKELTAVINGTEKPKKEDPKKTEQTSPESKEAVKSSQSKHPRIPRKSDGPKMDEAKKTSTAKKMDVPEKANVSKKADGSEKPNVSKDKPKANKKDDKNSADKDKKADVPKEKRVSSKDKSVAEMLKAGGAKVIEHEKAQAKEELPVLVRADAMASRPSTSSPSPSSHSTISETEVIDVALDESFEQMISRMDV